MTLIDRQTAAPAAQKPEADSLVAIAQAYLAYATEHRLPTLADQDCALVNGSQ